MHYFLFCLNMYSEFLEFFFSPPLSSFPYANVGHWRVNIFVGESESIQNDVFQICCVGCRLRLKCDGTRAETRLHLSAKRTSPFAPAGASIRSTAGSWGVRISDSNSSNAGHAIFRGSVKCTGYPLHSPVSPSLPLPCVDVCHHNSTGLYYSLCKHEPCGLSALEVRMITWKNIVAVQSQYYIVLKRYIVFFVTYIHWLIHGKRYMLRWKF